MLYVCCLCFMFAVLCMWIDVHVYVYVKRWCLGQYFWKRTCLDFCCLFILLFFVKVWTQQGWTDWWLFPDWCMTVPRWWTHLIGSFRFCVKTEMKMKRNRDEERQRWREINMKRDTNEKREERKRRWKRIERRKTREKRRRGEKEKKKKKRERWRRRWWSGKNIPIFRINELMITV